MSAVQPSVAEQRASPWYADWQHGRHAGFSDFRQTLDAKNLVRNDESFNDVRLLNERMVHDRAFSLLEIGCASGEFYRYLRIKYPKIDYYGLDISEPAVARARAKYPHVRFAVTRPQLPLREALRSLNVPARPEVLYAKDVMHHQTDPFGFLTQAFEIPSETVILRCRTRDVGATELNPEFSCQYHYGGWMPYIVVNLQELIDRIRSQSPAAEVVIYRNHMVLGGKYNRFLPKELYLKETGAAETAVGVFLRSPNPGQVTVKDRPDQNPRYTLGFRLKRYFRRAARIESFLET